MSSPRQARRTLRSIQRCLASSVPTPMLDAIDPNDGDAWASLAMLEIRMLLARGQTYQARQVAELLSLAAETGLAVESYERREIQQLINAIDAVQASRHYLALRQLEQVDGSSKHTIQWAAEMWRSRSLAREGMLDRATDAIERSLAIGDRVGKDAVQWATCFAAELQARTGDPEQAEERILRVLSHFVGEGETRGVSLAHLALAWVTHLGGGVEESVAAADLAYKTDGSWTGPVIWLARRALDADDIPRALDLLRSIPNPTTDAYNLVQALKLIEARDLPLKAVIRNLDAGDAAPNDKSLGNLRQLLNDHPRFWPARETLVWKLLSLDRPDDADAELRKMVDDSADSQSIAAVRFGLQTYEDEHQPAPPPRDATPVDGKAPARRKDKTAEVAPVSGVPEPASKQRSGFAGQISLFGVPDLLQFFCNSRRTGMVVFSSQRGDAKIRLHEGSLHWAVSPTHPSVGEFLRDKAAVTEAQLSLLDDSVDGIGLLPGQEGIDATKVREALQQIIHLTLRELVEWTEGWFWFDGIREASKPPAELLFNAQGVLLDVLRELDEENR